ncbi:MAG: hypothetical protein A2474_07280 [Elusimicrobia bacterium RIFOXYC2_FULL_34_12]|nr:MAG: hypothetical protein A2474_07280 [Elusimicrobia bacterium RIFOXYC2_FULL_34_12]HAM37899.1 DUF86 domain-containing protein [Elusimicrobiota bacterium]
MSKRNYQIFLKDIKDCTHKILEYVKDKSFSAFINDNMLVDAVMKNLMIIGEAVKKVPEEIRKKHKEIEWKKIAGFRDILIHHYFEIDNDVLWDIIRNKIPELKKQIDKIV